MNPPCATLNPAKPFGKNLLLVVDEGGGSGDDDVDRTISDPRITLDDWQRAIQIYIQEHIQGGTHPKKQCHAMAGCYQ